MNDILSWFAAGGPLMPVMLGLSLWLYALIAERAFVLFAPGTRTAYRRHELARLMASPHANQIDRHAEAIALAEHPELTRGLLVIRALVVAMPLMGLLGTVQGIMGTFAGLLEGDHARMSAQGVGEALITTEYGLAVAIPAVLADWLLNRRVRRLVATRQLVQAGALTRASGAGP